MKSKAPFGALVLVLVVLLGAQAIVADQPSEWETFSNSRYGYTLEYLKGWEVQVCTADNPSSSLTNNQRTKFLAPDGEHINVDVWENIKISLEEWYWKYEVPRLTWIAPPESPNARIAGEEAFMTIDPSRRGVPAQVVVTFLKENSIFQIEYTPTQNGTQFDAYRHMLETFEFGGEQTEDQISEVLVSKIQAPEVKAQVNTCCDIYTDLNGNPYSCGTGTGNCVWWANYMRPDLPDQSLGNAHEWNENIGRWPFSCCFDIDTSPEYGAIAVFEAESVRKLCQGLA